MNIISNKLYILNVMSIDNSVLANVYELLI